MATTTDQLRADIDSHRTRDKVAAKDPAAVPLGADEEAAGTPPTSAQVELARAQEVTPSSSGREGLTSVWIFVAIVVAFAAAIVAGVIYINAGSGLV